MQLLVITLLAIQVVLGQEKKLSINVTSDNQLTISVKGSEVWFHSDLVKVRNNGKWLSSADGSLILGDTFINPSEDRLGAYDYYSFKYHDSSKEFSFTTFVKDYKNVEAIVFGQRFNSGADKTAVDSADEVISSFPSILLEDSSLERGHVIFEGSSKLHYKHVI